MLNATDVLLFFARDKHPASAWKSFIRRHQNETRDREMESVVGHDTQRLAQKCMFKKKKMAGKKEMERDCLAEGRTHSWDIPERKHLFTMTAF